MPWIRFGGTGSDMALRTVAGAALLAVICGCEERSAPTPSIVLADPLVPPEQTTPVSPDPPASPARPPSAQAPESFKVLVYTATREAHVIIDGQPVGRTPGRINVPLRSHTVVFVADRQRRVMSVHATAGGGFEVPVHGDFEVREPGP